MASPKDRKSTTPETSDRYRIDAIDRAALVLSCFDFDRVQLSVREVVHRTGLHKATAHRILMALLYNGLVDRDNETGLYRLGLALYHLGEVAVSRLTLRDIAAPFLQELADKTGETSHVAVLDGLDVLYVEKVEGIHALRMPSRLGRRIPTYCTSLGKAMLSCLTDQQVRVMFKGRTFTAYTPQTIQDLDQLIQELNVVRHRGWSLDDEEIETGLRCVGSPIYDYTGSMAGALSIAAPSARLRKDRIPEVAALVKTTAAAVSGRLGYRSSFESRRPAGPPPRELASPRRSPSADRRTRAPRRTTWPTRDRAAGVLDPRTRRRES